MGPNAPGPTQARWDTERQSLHARRTVPRPRSYQESRVQPPQPQPPTSLS
ncbi:hypothetical protein LEMLEM_LOCUS4274 [Lemmus lemmus]